MPSFAPISILASSTMLQVPEGEAVMDAFGSEEAALPAELGLATEGELLPAQYLPPPEPHRPLLPHPGLQAPHVLPGGQAGPVGRTLAGLSVRRGSSDEVRAGWRALRKGDGPILGVKSVKHPSRL